MTSIQYETEFDIFYHIIMLVQNYSFKKKSHPTKSQLPAYTIYESISELYYILLFISEPILPCFNCNNFKS